MNHNMKLFDSPFRKIERGEKTIEVRLNDDKRKLFSVGDRIMFFNTEVPNLTIEAEVVAVHRFSSFKKLYDAFDYSKFGCGDWSEGKMLSSTYGIYSEEKELFFGVIGIEIEIK